MKPQRLGEGVWAVPRLCIEYPGICLTTESVYIYISGRWLVGLCCCLAGSSAIVTLVNLLHFCLFLSYPNPHVSLKSTLIPKVLRDTLLTTLVTQHDMRQNRHW